ncbi:MAG TPA: hypothetical protein V6D22_21525 [Candidatus Obscuribacterales bacterium]
MKKIHAAVLAALIVGSFAATTNVKADAERIIVNPGYGLGYGYGWHRHNFYRMYDRDRDRDNYWRWHRWQARRNFGLGFHRGWY